MNAIVLRVVCHRILEDEANIFGNSTMRLVCNSVKTRLDRTQVHRLINDGEIVGQAEGDSVDGSIENSLQRQKVRL